MIINLIYKNTNWKIINNVKKMLYEFSDYSFIHESFTYYDDLIP